MSERLELTIDPKTKIVHIVDRFDIDTAFMKCGHSINIDSIRNRMLFSTKGLCYNCAAHVDEVN